MSAQTASDYERLRAHLARFGRAEDRTELAEVLLELAEESIAPELALVVFHHPDHGRPTVFGGTFEQRRLVGRTLRRRGQDNDRGMAAVASAVGSLVRIVRIGDSTDLQGMILVGREDRSLRADELDYVQFLAGCAAENLRRLGLNSRVEELAEELQTSAAALDQQERMRLMSQMASGVASDVRSALSPITAFSTLLLATEQNTETRRYIELIQQAGNEVSDIVRSLNALNAPPAVEHNPALHVPELLVESIEGSRSRWSDDRLHNIAFQVDLADDLPTIAGERDLLIRAIDNLLFNAAEALDGRPGTIRVTARSEANAAGVDEVAITVVDDGPGMDTETLERCTHLFFTTREEEGAGVGLAQVRRAARALGGRFEISSVPARGTRACIFLPVPQEERAPLRLVPDDEAEPVTPPARILCIDDDAAVLRLLRTVFERDGHQVSTVEGGQAGVEAFVEGVQTGRPYDLVITDLRMPDLHGFGVIRAIRATDADVPILMLTAWMQQLPDDLADLAGLRIHSKPFDVLRVRLDIQDMLQIASTGG